MSGLRASIIAVVTVLAQAGVCGLARADEFKITDAARAHWAFQPVRHVDAPGVKDDGRWAKNDLDRFVLAKLEAKGIRPVKPAEKIALIRRATFDLTGLPPTPEEVESFVNDPSPDAYPRLVDRLLASPHYGERWGRHWLDLVRYADTGGDAADFPIPQAWRYRNWVIDAFNRDLPYDQFVKQQIAGDILGRQLPATASREQYESMLVATGYLAIARRYGVIIDKDHYQTIDDTIDTLGKSLLGLGLGCARCHDHKFDPVSMNDYYALYGIFDSTKFPFPGCEIYKKQKNFPPLMSPAEWDNTVEPHRKRLAQCEADVEKTRAEMATAAQAWLASAGLSDRSLICQGIMAGPGEEQKQLPRNKATPQESEIVVAPGDLIQVNMFPTDKKSVDFMMIDLDLTEVGGQNRHWNSSKELAESFVNCNPHPDSLGNSAVWWTFELKAAPEPPTLLTSVLKDKDIETELGLRGFGQPKGISADAVANAGTQTIISLGAAFPGKRVALRPARDGVGAALAWVSPIAGTIRIGGRLADIDVQGGGGVKFSIEHVRPANRTFSESLIAAGANSAAAVKSRDEELAHTPKYDVAYAVSEDDKPHDAAIFLRGEPKKPGAIVPRRFLEILGGQPVPSNAGSGRLELANWIASKDNPLTARVIVNRIWQHHFGRGIVKTPSDFGTRGTPPTSPELLDWLATRFVEDGWSIKKLHRLIMLSSAYQLSSDDEVAANKVDATNELHWRFDRRRLSAEEIRDTMLTVSGELDPTPGTSHPFPPETSWGFTQHNPFVASYETNKRTVYMMTPRIRRDRFLALFDAADSTASTAERTDTTVPPQALYFMNDGWVFARSDAMAKQLLALPDDAVRLSRAYRLCFGRGPTPSEIEQAGTFLRTYESELTDTPAEQREQTAWSAYARALFASNEMLYVD